MDKLTFQIKPRENPRWRDVRDRAFAAMLEWTEAGHDMLVTLSDILRTKDQNAAMWPALRDIAKQCDFAVVENDGSVSRADAEDVKDIFTAAFRQETRMARGLRGGMVMLGVRTSKFGKKQMHDFLTFLHAEGSERGVKWSAPAKEKFDEYGVARDIPEAA